MEKGQAAGNLAREPDDFRGSCVRGPAYPAVERFPLEQLHRKKDDVSFLARLINRHQMIMLDLRHGPRFAQETVPALGVAAHLGPHYLQRDGAGELDVLGEKDEPHASLAEQPKHAVVAEPADLVRLHRRQEEGEFFRRG